MGTVSEQDCLLPIVRWLDTCCKVAAPKLCKALWRWLSTFPREPGPDIEEQKLPRILGERETATDTCASPFSLSRHVPQLSGVSLGPTPEALLQRRVIHLHLLRQKAEQAHGKGITIPTLLRSKPAAATQAEQAWADAARFIQVRLQAQVRTVATATPAVPLLPPVPDWDSLRGQLRHHIAPASGG